MSELIEACKRADGAAVRAALAAGEDPNQLDEHRQTPLIYAARVPFADGVRVLLEAGAEPDLGKHWTPLALAGLLRRDEDRELGADEEAELLAVVEALLAGGANVNAELAFESPLARLVHRLTPISVLQRLLDAGAVCTGEKGAEALGCAVEVGRLDVVRLFLAAGADPNLRVTRWKTAALDRAVEPQRSSVDVDILRALVEAGADPVARKPEGGAPFTALLANRGIEEAKRLEGLGVLLGAAPADAAQTVLRGSLYLVAVQTLGYNAAERVPLARFLVEAGVPLDYQDSEGLSALNRAKKNRATELVALFEQVGMKEGVDPVAQALTAQPRDDQAALSVVAARFGVKKLHPSVRAWILGDTPSSGWLSLKPFLEQVKPVPIEVLTQRGKGVFPGACLGSDGAGTELWLRFDTGAVISVHHDSLPELMAKVGRTTSRTKRLAHLEAHGSALDLAGLVVLAAGKPSPEELLGRLEALGLTPEQVRSAPALEFVFGRVRALLGDP